MSGFLIKREPSWGKAVICCAVRFTHLMLSLEEGVMDGAHVWDLEPNCVAIKGSWMSSVTTKVVGPSLSLEIRSFRALPTKECIYTPRLSTRPRLLVSTD
jgi:hypothetical protein